MTIIPYLLVGVGIGIVSGLVGIGGGVLLIPALTMFFGVDPRKAAGISLAVLAVPVTFPGALQYYRRGVITGHELQMAAFIIVAFAAGTFIGATVQEKVDLRLLRLIFGLVLLFLAVRVLLYSSPEVYHTVGGLIAVGIGWVCHFGMRVIGRKHLPPPSLGDAIRRNARVSAGPDEYYI